jgi:hypothetical protein
MSFRYALRKLLVVSFIALGLFVGAPIDPAKIEELLSLMAQPKVAHTLRQKNDEGDGLRE